jgi:hypothetical protein
LDQIKQALFHHGPVQLTVYGRTVALFGYNDDLQCFYADGWGAELISYQSVVVAFCQDQAEAWASDVTPSCHVAES